MILKSVRSAASKIFPPSFAIGCKSTIHATDESALFTNERQFIESAGVKRRSEFTAGRIAAREALRGLGVSGTSILVGTGGAPLWPAGVVGSISHTDSCALAAVAKMEDIRSIGIDLERNGAVTPTLWKHVLSEIEIQQLQLCPPETRSTWATLSFSAKEAFYKLQYPLTREWIEYHLVDVFFCSSGKNFTVSLNHPSAVQSLNQREFSGYYAHSESFVLTGMWL